MSPIAVEICVDSIQGCRAALAGGADRIELCAGLVEGGTTPSAGTLEAACRVGIDVVALIRPRAGDFLYDEDELEAMRLDIGFARSAGAKGVALGILTPDGEIDAARTTELIELARPLEVCFHRAFDMSCDPREALEVLVGLGVDRILTSGQATRAEEGVGLLASLVDAAEERLTIMAGGGVRPHNVEQLVRASGVRTVHCTARTPRTSGMRYRSETVRMGTAAPGGEYELRPTDPDQVRGIVQAAENILGPSA